MITPNIKQQTTNKPMTRLSVNINKVALIRNARGENIPNLYQVARDCEHFGAQGITVHPRPDERHIRYADIPVIRDLVTTEFNIEGYPNDRFMELVIKHKPDQCTLVPDPPGVLTSNTGWDTKTHLTFLQDVIGRLQEAGIRVSLFLNAEPELIDSAKASGADRIELYTGPYAASYHAGREKAIAPFVETATTANSVNLGVNAGHDLNLDNLKYFKANIPGLLEVSIGQALISDALYFGLQNTIQMYLNLLK
jgi:pyridoxine 5-phosphate synthase